MTGAFKMLQTNKLNYYIFAVLLSTSMGAFAADSFTGDVKEVVRDTGKNIEKAADAVGDAVSDAGTFASDSAITTAVKAKFAAEKDIPFKLSVTTTN